LRHFRGEFAKNIRFQLPAADAAKQIIPMVRLKDIAERAGCSVMTVSKALRDAKDISAATKARIKAMAKEMGYVPDSMAQALRSRSTRLLGVVISTTTNPIFSRLLVGLEEKAHELGYDLVLAHTLNQPEREEEVIRSLIARRVDGIFISPVYRMSQRAPIYEELKQRNIPVVLLGHPAPFCTGFCGVETDDVAASQASTRHLIELGHRQIAFFAGPQTSPWAAERFDGYRRALREAGIPYDDHLLFSAGATIQEGEKAALQWLNERPVCTAIQCNNDLVAIGAAATLLDQGIRIPEEISVVGFGNVLTAEFFRVPLTTIRQPKLRLGSVAMGMMMDLLKGRTPDVRRLPGELIIRRSSAPPDSSASRAVTGEATGSAGEAVRGGE
jgi:DNA-binding LacI/PurR family transcriptional regulator